MSCAASCTAQSVFCIARSRSTGPRLESSRQVALMEETASLNAVLNRSSVPRWLSLISIALVIWAIGQSFAVRSTLPQVVGAGALFGSPARACWVLAAIAELGAKAVL